MCLVDRCVVSVVVENLIKIIEYLQSIFQPGSSKETSLNLRHLQNIAFLSGCQFIRQVYNSKISSQLKGDVAQPSEYFYSFMHVSLVYQIILDIVSTWYSTEYRHNMPGHGGRKTLYVPLKDGLK